MVVSHVDVSGGADTLIVTFYYVDQSTMRSALGAQQTSNIEVKGDRATIRSEPIARVALPVTVAFDLFGQAAEAIADGVPELQSSIMDLRTKFVLAIERFGSMQTSSSQKDAEGAG